MRIIFILSALLILPIQVRSESPFRTKPGLDYFLTASGTAVFSVSYGFLSNHKKSIDIATINPNNDNLWGIDRPATQQWNPGADKFSDLTLILTLGSGIPLLFSDQFREDYKIVGLMSLQLIMATAGITQLSKITLPRARPYVYNQNLDNKLKQTERANQSFFSRTTTMAFASSIYINELHKAYYPESHFKNLLFFSSMGFALTTGFLRFYSGQHFPTDIITGALVGASLGFLIPYAHKNHSNPVSLVITPMGFALSMALGSISLSQ